MKPFDDPGLAETVERAERGAYQTQRFYLQGEGQLARALACLRNAPLDPSRPLEVVICEREDARGLDANALMWAGTLHDIEQQAWMKHEGEWRRFRAEVWHHYFKKEYLPEQATPGITRKGYAKWAVDPGGERVLVGSTKMLTKKGFAEYLTQVEAHGANLGVMYHANPHENRGAR